MRLKRNSETVLSQVVHGFCDFSNKQVWLRQLLVLWMVAYHLTSFGISVCILTRATALSLNDLVFKMEAVVLFCVQLPHLLWWKNRVLLRDVLRDLTELYLHTQVPVELRIRKKLIVQCESRQKFIRWAYNGMGFSILMSYLIPPLVTYMTDSSPENSLKLPIGMCNPFTSDGQEGSGSTWGFLYLICAFCYVTLSFVCFQNLILNALFLNTLRTLYHLSGLAFLTSRNADDVRTTIQFHQRVLRLSSRVKVLLEPPLSATVCCNVCNTMCGLGVIQLSSGIPVFISAVVLLTVPMYLAFALPAFTTHTAGKVANSVYFNKNWVGRKFKPAASFPLIIMRANQGVKFRMFRFWVLSLENYIEYLKTLYSLFIILRSVTSRSRN